MNPIDLFVVCWWISILICLAGSRWFVQWSKQRQNKAAELAVSRAAWSGYGAGAKVVPTELGVTNAFSLLVFISSIAIAVFGGLALLLLHNRSSFALLSFQVILCGLGLMLLATGVRSYFRPSRSASVWLSAAAGLLLTGFGAWQAVGDYFLARDVMVGRISETVYRFRRIEQFYREIEGIRYPTTGDTFAKVKIGDLVRAHVGVGSKTVLQLDHLR